MTAPPKLRKLPDTWRTKEPLQRKETDNAGEPLPPLFPYQKKTSNFVVAGHSGQSGTPEERVVVVASAPGRAILYIDPGLGKSRIAIDATIGLCPAAKIVVLCSKKALNTWRREWTKWTTAKIGGYPNRVIIVEGSPQQRANQWKTDAQIYVTTFGCGVSDWIYIEAHNPQMVIADECKLWRNQKTKQFKFWQHKLQKVRYLLLMDGTLASRGPQDLWTFLNMIKPKLFSSYWKYVNTFCDVYDGPFGKEILGPKNTEGLARQLEQVMVRIKDSDPEVESQRPPLLRDKIPLRLTIEQAAVYQQLVDHLMAITPGGELVASASQMALTIKLRQLLICPKILDPKMGYGAAIDQLLLEAEDDPHIVIFTPFAKAIPFMATALREAGHPAPYILQGGKNSNEVRHVEEEFNSPKGQNSACICTVGFAESFELPTARQCFFNGFEWSQLMNYQAEKRLLRITTKHAVNAWYLVHEGTVDEDIMGVLNRKQHNVNVTFQDYVSAVRRLHYGKI